MNQRESQICAWDYIACSQMIDYYDNHQYKSDKPESREHFETRMRKFGLTEEDVKFLTEGM